MLAQLNALVYADMDAQSQPAAVDAERSVAAEGAAGAAGEAEAVAEAEWRRRAARNDEDIALKKAGARHGECCLQL
eukprot:SAG22_NODE_6783_length_811_cov_2.228933_1_plen_76_part_00